MHNGPVAEAAYDAEVWAFETANLAGFGPAGGITRPFSAPATIRISLLLALSPGSIAGPD